MSYQVRFTDVTKQPIVVDDQTLNSETSVTFVGKNYPSYGQTIAENFLHLLENFARSSPPTNPISGQLWYDTTIGINNQLKLYDGTRWVSAGNVKKSNTTPDTGVIGDLWVDTDNQQLYLFNGSSWILVGPQFSSGQKTGAEVELISDSVGNLIHPVLSLYVNDKRVAIISEREFTPKSLLEGYDTLKQGLNLSTKNFNSSQAGTKIWGVSEKSESLIVGSIAVAASNFLRSDQLSTTNFGFNVRNNAGISIGGDLALSISVDNTGAVVYNKLSGSNIDFKLKTSTASPIVLRIDSNERVGINNLSPDEALDVNGNIKTNQKLLITGNENSNSLITGSFQTLGGAAITRTLRVGEGTNITGNSTVENVYPKTNITYDLGTNTLRWKSIYANEVVSNSFVGNFNGFLTGNVSGAATSLVSTTQFRLGDSLDGLGNIIQASDVISSNVPFNGSTATGSVVLTGIIASSFIANKTEATESLPNDEFLVNKSGSLRRMSKQTFLKNVPTMPAGVILPFAGTVIPAGYLLCDGSEVLIANYPELFAVIQYSYKPLSLITSGFAAFGLPDLRGRFPLGRDNMSNSGGSVSADRNTDVAADSLGGVGGMSEVTLTRNNLPQHVHTLRGNAGTQFYAVNTNSGSPSDTNATASSGLNSSSQGQLLADSGGIFVNDLVSNNLSVPFNITNHYQTVNYIIFTGRIS